MKKIEITIIDDVVNVLFENVSITDAIGAIKIASMKAELLSIESIRHEKVIKKDKESEKPKDSAKKITELSKLIADDKAIFESKPVIKVQKPNAKIPYGKGITLMTEKKYVEALKAFNEALAIDPTMKSAIDGKLNAERWIKKLDELYEEKSLPKAEPIQMAQAEEDEAPWKDDVDLDLIPDDENLQV